MKYSVPRYKPPINPTVVVKQGQDITEIAWEREGRMGEYALEWRRLCQMNGIIDPMQYAPPASYGNDPYPEEYARKLLGQSLRVGMKLQVP